MVLFVLYHINKVLPKEKPIRIEAIMANTGWDYIWMTLQEADPEGVHRWLEKELPMEEVNTPELLWEAIRDADRHRKKAIQKDTEAQEQSCQWEKRQRQTDLVFHTHNHQKDKEHVTAAAAAKACDKEAMPPPPIPPHLRPQEKILTTTMPPAPTLSHLPPRGNSS